MGEPVERTGENFAEIGARRREEWPKVRYASTSKIGSPLEIIKGRPCVS